MTAIVSEPEIARRRRLGLDRRDEVWEGRYVVPPDPHSNHGEVQGEVRQLLKPVARRTGMQATTTFNLGREDDYRVPDAGLVSVPGTWHDTAELVVEVLPPGDETFAKLDFYTAHGVRELLALDWRDRSVRYIDLKHGQHEVDASQVLGMTTADIVAAIEWPPLGDGIIDDETP